MREKSTGSNTYQYFFFIRANSWDKDVNLFVQFFPRSGAQNSDSAVIYPRLIISYDTRVYNIVKKTDCCKSRVKKNRLIYL